MKKLYYIEGVSHFRSYTNTHAEPSLLARWRLFSGSPHLLQNYVFSLLFTQRLSKVILAYLAGRHASFNINSPCDSPFPSNLSSNTWGYKGNQGCLQSDFALGFGTSNWSQAHTPPIRGAHPARPWNCQAGWQLAHSPVALHPLAESPFLSFFDITHLPGLRPRRRKLFFPFPGAHLQVSPAALPRAPTRSPLLQSSLRDSSPNSWHPAALQQLRTAPVGKQWKPTKPPPRAVSEEAGGSSLPGRVSASPRGRWQGSESPAR